MVGGKNDPWRLRDALAGDAAAWEGIVDEFAQSVWNWARSQGLNREDAQDVSQTVWYRLKDKGDSIRDPRTLPGWLATTTRREAIRVAKKRENAIDNEILESVPDSDDSDTNPAQSATTNDLRERLAEGFASLRPLCRELLALCWQDELSYKEIAAELDRTVGWIGPTRQRCLADLKVLANVT